MTHSASIDRELLHSWLYVNRDGRGLVSGTQQQIAVSLGCTAPTVSRLFGELSAAGKLVKQGRRFKVIDPEETPILN